MPRSNPPARPARTDRTTATHRGLFAVLVPGLASLALGLYYLSLPNALTGMRIASRGYDDGVYYGAAVRLLHGSLPYRDFVLVHPPGIALLMSPMALLGEAIGNQNAVGIARVVTVVVVALNASIAAIAVRHRGPRAMFVAGMALACFPLTVTAGNSIRLEPYLTLFCLLGFVFLFQNGAVAPQRRVLLAGLMFGIAASIKVWAVMPFAAALLVCLPWSRRSLRTLIPGAAVGFLVPVLPFFLAAPGRFLHDVVSAQLGRPEGTSQYPLRVRLIGLSGLRGIPTVHASTANAVVLVIVLTATVAAGYLLRSRDLQPADLAPVLAAGVVIAGLLTAPIMYVYYSTFAAPFVAMALGVAVAVLAAYLDEHLIRQGRRIRTRWLLATGGVVVAALLLPQQASYARGFLAGSRPASHALASVIPKGACVAFDQPMQLILIDRLIATNPACPDLLDPFGVWLAEDGQPPSLSAPANGGFVHAWAQRLARSDYVEMLGPYSNYLPWSPGLRAWFDSQFTLVYMDPDAVVYRRTGNLPPPDSRLMGRDATAHDLVAQGIALEHAHDLTQALLTYQAAVMADANSPSARFYLGHLHEVNGNPAGAELNYLQAVSLKPDFGEALFGLGVLETGRNPAAAIGWYRKALRVEPTSAVTNLNLGVLLVRNGEPAAGERLIRVALKLEPRLRSAVPRDLLAAAGRA